MNITAKTSPDELPDDLETLRRMVLLLLANDDEKTQIIQDLKNQLENLKRRLFGRRSEKLDENQLQLFAELLHQAQNSSPEPSPETTIDSKSSEKKFSRPYIGDRKDVVFDFTPTRSREGPVDFLDKYHGYLQADAYNGYDAVFEDQTIIEVGCWAHARRKSTRRLRRIAPGARKCCR